MVPLVAVNVLLFFSGNLILPLLPPPPTSLLTVESAGLINSAVVSGLPLPAVIADILNLGVFEFGINKGVTFHDSHH